jgi:hypothetical protein
MTLPRDQGFNGIASYHYPYFTDTSLTGSHLQILLGDGAGNFTTDKT